MLHGWIVLDKPVGLSSAAAVAAVKRALRQAGEPRTKVGHGGTLDPLASGVLPIAIGEATKLAGWLLGSIKSYEFTIRFGEETDTLDSEGDVVSTSYHRPSVAEIETILPLFTGEIEQTPPAYSALKVGGKPAYARARAGEDVELKARTVTVRSISICYPRESRDPEKDGLGSRLRGNDEVTFSCTVSKGTYIRALARDIARALNSAGHVTMLWRTCAGPFTLESAISLDFLTEAAKARDLTRAVLPLEAALDDIPALPVTPEQARLLRHGQRLAGFPERPGLQLATADTVPVALVEATADGLKVVRGFNL